MSSSMDTTIQNEIKKKYDQLAEAEFQQYLRGERSSVDNEEKNTPETQVKRILQQVLTDEKNNRNVETAKQVLDPMSKIAQQVNQSKTEKEKFVNLPIREILLRLSNTIRDISIELTQLYSMERIETIGRIYTNEPISYFLNILQLSKLSHILMKDDRMIYVGIMCVFISICLYFIFGTSG